MKKRIILFSTLALVLAAVLIWCTLPKETLASISGGELKMVRISAINPDKRNPTHQKTLELTEGELFAQYADFFYHHAVSPKSVQSMEEMVYTEEALAYNVGYTFVLEPGEQGIYCVSVDPLGDSGALVSCELYRFEQAGKSAAEDPTAFRLTVCLQNDP